MPDLPRPYRSQYDGPFPSREQVIAAYRAFADLLEAHPEVPAPTYPAFDLYVGRDWTADADAPDTRRERVAAILRVLPGTYGRHERDGGFMAWQGELEGVLTTIRVEREAVCRKVVRGVETVEVPATAEVVIPARPARTETREVVEWECEPVLTGDGPQVPAEVSA